MLTRKDILNILFWIFLIIGIILLLWRIFGNSPTDLAVILPFILMLLFKMWVISDNLNEFKHEVKLSFHKIKSEFNDIKTDINSLKTNFGGLENKINKKRR